MTLEQIKNAVLSGDTVHWKTAAYTVIRDSIGQWLVVCPSTRGCWGLTWANGVTLNGEPGEFFLAVVTPSIVAQWLRPRLTDDQLADVVSGRLLAGDVVEIPADWPEDVVMDGIESLACLISSKK